MVSEEDVAQAVVCGPDADAHAAAIDAFADAGYTHVVHQVGPDQEGFFRFYEAEILAVPRSRRRATREHLRWHAAGVATARPAQAVPYVDASGERITDDEQLERIERLAIPPAWTDVWISPSASARLQATGVDAAGRRQYRYHPA